LSDILDGFDLEAWIKAIHDNWTSFWLISGETSIFNSKETPRFILITSDHKIPMFNRVMRSRLTESNADEKIQETLEYYAVKEIPFVWQVYPGDTPDDLPRRLEGHGFTREEGRGMAMLIEDLNSPEIPEGFTYTKVTTRKILEAFATFLPDAYGMPESTQKSLSQNLMELGIRDDLCHYLGFLDGTPIAGSSVFYSNGVAGIHNVATSPDARGRGLGSVISAAPLSDARDLGYKVSILLSSKMGYNMYKRLGYVEYCKPVTYEWSLPS